MPVPPPSSRLRRKRGGSAAIFGVIVVAYLLTTTSLSNIVANHSKDEHSLPSSLDNSTMAVLRPKLSSILDLNSGQLIGDPQFLLDFAVVGHGKCKIYAIKSD
jgi:hypothetical protein